jgi:hypothetical protein
MKGLAIVLLVMLPIGAAAQTTAATGDWQKVRALANGSHVRVTQRNGSRVSGSIVAVSASSMTIMASGQSQEIAIQEVRKLQTPLAWRRTLQVIGIPLGVVAGYFVCPQCANEGNEEAGRRNMIIGGAAGALMLLIPAYRTVYEVP